MPRPKHAKKLLLEIADRCLLFMSEGRVGPYAAAMGREAYEAMLQIKTREAEKRRMQRLKHQKLIAIYHRGDHVAIILTKKGACAALRERVIHETKRLPPQHYCLVTFDVPERTRETRDLFRRFLKQARFTQVHQSAWITNYDVADPLKHLVRKMHAGAWIQIYLAKHA